MRRKKANENGKRGGKKRKISKRLRAKIKKGGKKRKAKKLYIVYFLCLFCFSYKACGSLFQKSCISCLCAFFFVLCLLACFCASFYFLPLLLLLCFFCVLCVFLCSLCVWFLEYMLRRLFVEKNCKK